MNDGFLGRWSRLKREAGRPSTVAPAEPDPPLPLTPDQGANLVPIELGVDPVAEASDHASPEEIAALPHPDELTPEADLAPFLRKGVPDLLRKAALRRMWSLDPAIRDAIGDARDYAYDWNVAGGVPGFSPLAADFDATGLVERMFARQPEPDEVADQAGEQPSLAAEAGGPADQVDEPPGPPVLDEVAATPRDGTPPATLVSSPDPSEPEPPRRRRHGSAVPN